MAQKKYKARHDWVGKVIHWEICKKFKFERMWKEGLVPRPCKRIEKTMENEGDNYTNCDWCFWYSN